MQNHSSKSKKCGVLSNRLQKCWFITCSEDGGGQRVRERWLLPQWNNETNNSKAPQPSLRLPGCQFCISYFLPFPSSSSSSLSISSSVSFGSSRECADRFVMELLLWLLCQSCSLKALMTSGVFAVIELSLQLKRYVFWWAHTACKQKKGVSQTVWVHTSKPSRIIYNSLQSCTDWRLRIVFVFKKNSHLSSEGASWQRMFTSMYFSFLYTPADPLKIDLHNGKVIFVFRYSCRSTPSQWLIINDIYIPLILNTI